MPYKYGVSFNCTLYAKDGRTEVGGGAEGYTSVDYVGNDLTKIEEGLCKNEYEYEMLTDHEYVGAEVDVGGKTVAVFVDRDGSVVSVVFTEPNAPTVIE